MDMKVKKYTPYYVQVDYEALSATLIVGDSRFHRITKDDKESDINWIKEIYGNNVYYLKQISEFCEIDLEPLLEDNETIESLFIIDKRGITRKYSERR